jgi:hypothetical protein
MPNLRNIELKPKYTIKENSYNDINFEKRLNMFKGTIITCVAYGIVAFLLMLLTAFSTSTRIILFNNFLPFTLVFIIGTILIICLMVYFIFSYIPVNITYRLDGLTCPDYWDVELLDDNYINNSFDPTYPSSYFKYKCVMNKNIFDTRRMFIDSSNLVNDNYRSNAYKYTNILDSLKKSDSADKGLSGTYHYNSNIVLDTDLTQLKDYAKLYKDVNKYTESDIKRYINTNSDALSSNILNDLRKIALVQNNYKILSKYNTNDIQDLISTSNLWNSSTSSVSPITWHYKFNIDNTVGTPPESSNITADNDISALILDWRDLTPEKAFYNGYDIVKDNTEENKISYKELYIYYNPNLSDSNLNLLGKIEITSNSSNNPTISMKFIPDVKGQFFQSDNLIETSQDYILDPKHIIIGKNKPGDTDLSIRAGTSFINLTKSTLSPYSMTLTNNPLIQLYNNKKARPSIISSTEFNNKQNAIPLNCDELYPSLLESIDDNNNNIRCAYSKICGIPWSDLRCPLTNSLITHGYYTN